MSQQTLANMVLIVISAFWGLSYDFMKLGLGSLQTLNIVVLAKRALEKEKVRA